MPRRWAEFVPFGPDLDGYPRLQWASAVFTVICAVYVFAYLAIL